MQRGALEAQVALDIEMQRGALEAQVALQLGLEPLPAEMLVLLKARRHNHRFSKEGVAVCGMRRLGEALMPGPSMGATHGLVAVCFFCVQHVRAGRESSVAPLGREHWSSSWGEQRLPLALPLSHPSRPEQIFQEMLLRA